MKLRLFVLFLGVSSLLSGAGIAEKPLFSASFEKSADADSASGIPVCRTMEPEHSAKLLAPGKEGKGLKLRHDQICSYALTGNFNPGAGTISFWAAPQNWRFSASGSYNTLAEVYQGNLWMMVYKYEYADGLYFFVRVRHQGKDHSFKAVAFVNDKIWPVKSWHKVDAVWDTGSGKLMLYLDGKLPKAVSWRKPAAALPRDVVIPAPDEKYGTFSLGRARNFSIGPKYKAEAETVFDNVRIYDRALSAEEIKLSYQQDIQKDKK